MPNHERPFYTFNSSMHKKWLTYLLLFFIPIVVFIGFAEYFTRELPTHYKVNANYLSKSKDELQVVVLGSSQLRDAINPEHLTIPAINLASGNQHHDTDLKIIKGLISELPKLETVVIELSYSHLELPHNTKRFWKNSIYWEAYGVNAFERPTYFKDRLLYLSNPHFYSKKIYQHYQSNTTGTEFNKFGFNNLNSGSLFSRLEYDETKIMGETKFKINTVPNVELFNSNTAFLQEFVSYLSQKDLNIVIAIAPLFKSIHGYRNTEILERRNSVLDTIQKKFPEVLILNKETDLNYQLRDFGNHNHLSPTGAETFSKELNEVLLRF